MLRTAGLLWLAKLSVGAQIALAGTAGQEIRVLVIPIENLSSRAEYAPIATGLTDFLLAELSAYPEFALVDAESLQRAIQEVQLQAGGLATAEGSIRAGKILKASHVLAGSLFLQGDQLRIATRLYDVSAARLYFSAEASGKPKDLGEISKRLAASIFERWKLQKGKRRVLPVDVDPETSTHYVRGLGFYHAGLYSHAIAEFLQTMFLNPRHAEARFWLAKSYVALKSMGHARIELERFLEDFKGHPLAAEALNLLGK